MNQPFVSLVVPTRRNPGPLAETLRSLSRVDYPPGRREVVVVDDGRDEETARVFEEVVADLDIAATYSLGPQRGAAAARNLGARLAGGEILIFVDDDMLVPSTLIVQHLEALSYFEPTMICGYREFSPRLVRQLSSSPFGRFRLKAEHLQEWADSAPSPSVAFPDNCRRFSPGVTANNLSIRRDDFARIGGFDERFPNAGYEDQDLALRAEFAGIDGRVHYGLIALHNDRRVTLRQFCERQRRGAQNAVIMAKKFPVTYAHQSLIIENGPAALQDGAPLIAKKLIKRALASAPGRALMFPAIEALERVSRRASLLDRAYTIATGVYIFLGVREGFRDYA